MTVDQLCVTPMMVFCYLVTDDATGEAVLIDPAGDFDKITSKINERQAKVKHIINTHGHPDHTWGNETMMAATGADVMIHGEDLRMLKGGYSATVLADGDIISFGKTSLTVMHTPGHTRGGVCLYGGGCVFTGDTLFTEGIGRTDIEGASMKALVNSIRGRIFSLPEDTKVYPGHDYGPRPVSTVGEQKRLYGAV